VPFNGIRPSTRSAGATCVSRKSFIESDAREQRKSSLSKLERARSSKAYEERRRLRPRCREFPETADDVEGPWSHDRGQPTISQRKLHEVFKTGTRSTSKVLRVDDKGKLCSPTRQRRRILGSCGDARLTSGTKHKGTVVRNLQPFGGLHRASARRRRLIHTSDLKFNSAIEHRTILSRTRSRTW